MNSDQNENGMGPSLEVVTPIAIACHQANKAWCEANGDHSQKNWEEAEEWQRESAIKGVEFRINNPDAGEDAQHEAWRKDKADNGWVYGKEKNIEAKTHPCMVDFKDLPEFQQRKDRLFCAIVDAMIGRKPKAPAQEPLDNNSFGAQLVRVEFNPGNNDEVQNLKEAGAHFLNRIQKIRLKKVNAQHEGPRERAIAIAVQHLQTGIMYAVNAATFPKAD